MGGQDGAPASFGDDRTYAMDHGMSTDPLPATIQQLSQTDIALARALLNVFGTAFEDEATCDASASSDAYLKNCSPGSISSL